MCLLKARSVLLHLLLCLLSLPALSQIDIFPGTWKMEAKNDNSVINIELLIATPERGLLYPASLKIKHGSFSGTYHLLLAKKSITQLGISKNKKAVSEIPFSLDNWTIFLNNLFTYSKNGNGTFLTLERILTKNYGIIPISADTIEEQYRPVAKKLKEFLQNGEIILKKENPYPWRDAQSSDSILHGSSYYGIKDTIHVKSNNPVFEIIENKKGDNDTVTVMLNGRTVIAQADIRKKTLPEEPVFEKGENIAILFADNYGKVSTNKGKAQITSGKRKVMMDFNDPKDAGATFIIKKFYYYQGKEDSIASATSRSGKMADQTLQRIVKPVGDVVTKSEQITLALWDDAVEDGDSISLNINGKWLVQGFAVKKRTQFIQVTLEPGPNKIVFIADNLGSIVPNTTVLEIIDGLKRKSFTIETNYDKNNMINIFYDYNPEK